MLTRRQFLARAAAASAVAGVAGCFPDVGGTWPHVTGLCEDDDPIEPVTGAGRVVEVLREDSVLEGTDPATGGKTITVQAAALRPMLEAALGALAGGSTTPWATLLPDATAATRVGIKVNCLNPYLPTSTPLVKALVDSLREGLGLPAENVLVWDRRKDELSRFVPEDLGCQVVGTVNSTTDAGGPGYAFPGCGYVAGKAPRLSRILTDLTDLTINVPVLKTHNVSGVTAALKNIYGIIHNPGDYHDTLATALPELYRLPPIRRHIRLTILDALVCVTTGGTSDPPDTIGRRLLAAIDPLALDTRALALVNELRAAKDPPQRAVEGPQLAWLDHAHGLGLGAREVELVQV